MPVTDADRAAAAKAVYAVVLKKIRLKAPSMFEPTAERYLSQDHQDVVDIANAALDVIK